MGPDTELMKCLGNYASIPPSAPTGVPAQEQAAFYCSIYSQLAACWAVGRYCREWYPLEVSAAKFCALANGTEIERGEEGASVVYSLVTLTTSVPVSTITSAVQPGATLTAAPQYTSTLSSVVSEAHNVIVSIWHNDVGTASTFP